MGCDKLFLEETGSAALDAVEFIVNLVRAVKGHVDQGAAGKRVELDIFEAGFNDQLAGLVACWHEEDVGDAVVFQCLDGLNYVNDGATRADAHILGRGVEVVINGFDCSVALCSFNVRCHWDWYETEGGGGDGSLG